MKKFKANYFRHNQVRLIKGGHEYFELLEEMIDEARQCIHMQVYIFDEDETGTRIADALLRAAERGVKIYLLLDAYGSQQFTKQRMLQFRKAGIFVRKFRPLFKSRRFYMGRRLHHKVIVTDSHRCMVGGINISDRYNDMEEARAWLDWALYAEGEVAPALEKVCKSRLRLRKVYAVAPPPLPEKVCEVGVRVNDWLRRKREIYRSYLRMFTNASSEMIIMSAYFLPGRRFRKKIEEATKRGVRIKVVLTGSADVHMIKYAERYIYRWMLRNNIAIYEYHKSVLHAKIAVCDGEWVTVGSFNVNNLSAYASIELNLDVNNKPFAGHVQQRLEQIISRDCVAITEIDHNKSGLLAQAAQLVSYEIFRFLFFLSTRQRG